jgi:hypothetical protein
MPALFDHFNSDLERPGHWCCRVPLACLYASIRGHAYKGVAWSRPQRTGMDYSMTPSASTRSFSGTVNPNARAVPS